MSNIVAIVGRPNVGKSTLFNRILGARASIVHDLPGVTRDRIYASTEWAGKPFTIIDTGGFVPRSKDQFEQAIREQAKIAIEEADVVIFVVDVTAGLTPLDEELGAVLRKSKKRVHLVINKVDDQKHEPLAASFYKLGFAESSTIAALGGRKIGDFLDEITSNFSTREGDQAADARLHIAIVGRPNVGKSSLVNSLLGVSRSIVTDIPGTTRDSIDSVLKFHGEEVILVDTAGLRRQSKIIESVEFYSALRTLKAIDRANISILLLDATAGLDKQDLRILERIIERRRGSVIAVNKWDLVEKDDKTAREYERSIQKALRMYDYVPIMFISAAEKTRIFKLIELAKAVQAESRKRISTSSLNATILQDIAMTPPAAYGGKEIKINYVTQVKANAPVFTFFVNDPKGIQENYKRFLESRLREHFDFMGVPLTLQFRRKH